VALQKPPQMENLLSVHLKMFLRSEPPYFFRDFSELVKDFSATVGLSFGRWQ